MTFFGVLCRSRISIGSFTLGAAGVLCLVLFALPWSPSTQPSGFSVTLDLDDAAGDQAVSSIDLLPDQPVSVQIFASDIQNAQGISARFGYDPGQIAFDGFDPGEALPNAHANLQQDSTSFSVGVSSLSGSATVNTGLVGTVRLRTTAAFSDTEIWLVDDGSSTSRTVAENTPARRPIQHPVNASDPDGHRVTYNLSGADSASFSVDTGSGQLRTLSGITYDFEDNDRYSVELVGSDPYGESATIGVTIHVADVNEPPEIPAAPLVQPASTTSLTVTWDAPDNTGPGITDYDVQYRKSGNFIPHTHDGPGTSATIIELDVNTRYEVQVRATNDEGTSEWSPSAEIEHPNHSPVAVGSFDDLTPAVSGAVEIVSSGGVFTDQDKDKLTFTASSGNTGTATVRMIGAEILIDPQAAGSATITVTARDSYGASGSETFDVTVQTPSLSAPTLTKNGNLFTLALTDDFAAEETRAYHVRIRKKANHGPWATGCDTETNDEASQQTISVTLEDAVSDFFEPGTVYEADYGYLGASCDGSRDGHWRESVLEGELMTSRLEFSSNPLSAITIQSMADMGYTVDATQAVAYTLPATSKSRSDLKGRFRSTV